MKESDYNYQDRVDSPPTRHFEITPHDTNALTVIPKCLYIGVSGNIAIEDKFGTQVVYPVAAGIFIFRAAKVLATGTTATNIVGQY